jgi:hypothetical protein
MYLNCSWIVICFIYTGKNKSSRALLETFPLSCNLLCTTEVVLQLGSDICQHDKIWKNSFLFIF